MEEPSFGEKVRDLEKREKEEVKKIDKLVKKEVQEVEEAYSNQNAKGLRDAIAKGI